MLSAGGLVQSWRYRIEILKHKNKNISIIYQSIHSGFRCCSSGFHAFILHIGFSVLHTPPATGFLPTPSSDLFLFFPSLLFSLIFPVSLLLSSRTSFFSVSFFLLLSTSSHAAVNLAASYLPSSSSLPPISSFPFLIYMLYAICARYYARYHHVRYVAALKKSSGKCGKEKRFTTGTETKRYDYHYQGIKRIQDKRKRKRKSGDA